MHYLEDYLIEDREYASYRTEKGRSANIAPLLGMNARALILRAKMQAFPMAFILVTFQTNTESQLP